MRKHILFCAWAGISSFFLVSQLFAQAPDSIWSRTFGGSNLDRANSVQQTADGGYVMAGVTTSFGAGDIDLYIVKTNACGTPLWTRTYGGSDDDRAQSVKQTADGGYIVAGMTRSFGPGTPGCYNMYLVKTNSQGDTLWTRAYGGSDDDCAYSIQQTPDGGYIVAGYTQSFGAGGADLYLVKTNGQGDTLWTRTYGGSDADVAVSAQQTTDGGYMVAGYTFSFGPDVPNLYLVKTNSQGVPLWARTYGGFDYDVAYSAQQTRDGGYILAGATKSFGAGLTDMYLVKTNGLGDTLWTRAYGGSNHDWANSVQQTADGGYIIAGATLSFGAGSSDFYLVKTNTLGAPLWTQTHGGSSYDEAFSVQQIADGGYIVAGETQSFGAGVQDMWLLRLGLIPPDIISIRDVGNDQGRQARIRWYRSAYDDICATGETITSYSIYRRIDQYLLNGGGKAGHSGLDWPPGEWEYIKTVPARGEAEYATIVPTLADSTSLGIYWSVFFVSAETPNPLVYFDSDVDSGYSVDNLPPDETILTAMVQTAPGRIHLQWQAITTGGGGQPELGEIWYHVYGSTDPMFTPGPSNLLTVTQSLEFTHAVGTNQKYFYIIQASDDH